MQHLEVYMETVKTMSEHRNSMFKDNKFMDVNGTFGMIIRGCVDDMNYIIEQINEYTELDIVYQKSSSNELYITPEKPVKEMK